MLRNWRVAKVTSSFAWSAVRTSCQAISGWRRMGVFHDVPSTHTWLSRQKAMRRRRSLK